MGTKRPTPKNSPAPKRREPKKRASDPTLWADIAALFASVPEEDWASVPRDAARRFDKYYLETLR